MKKFALATLLALLFLSRLGEVASANHLPLYTPIKWGSPHLTRMWATSFPNDAKRDRIREVNEHNAACYASTCDTNSTPSSWARWYINDDSPHVDIADSTTVANYNFDSANSAGNPTHCLYKDYRLSFHWEDRKVEGQGAGNTFTEGGSAQVCPFSKNTYTCESVTQQSSSYPTTGNKATSNAVVGDCPTGQVPVWQKTENYLGSAAIVINSRSPVGYSWWTEPVSANGSNVPSNKFDFQSVIAHEMGHVFNLNHYVANTQGGSGDQTCTQHNSHRLTMCPYVYPGEKREVTPEQDEKDTFNSLY